MSRGEYVHRKCPTPITSIHFESGTGVLGGSFPQVCFVTNEEICRIQEKTWKTKDKLERRSEQGSSKNGINLGRG